jgi:MFS transporter, ACS family, D-galactonate transporter
MTIPPTSVRYRTVAWLTIAAAVAYLCRNAVGVAESTIRVEFELTYAQSGWFMGAFFWTYALFQVPSGWLAQSYGTRFTLTIFALAWSAATFGIGIASGFWLLIVAQLLMGTAQAGIFPASCNSVGHWMPFARRSLACGILVAGMQVGAVAASGLTGPMTESMGWRWVFVIFAIPGVLWAVWFFVRFRNYPEQSTGVNAAELALIHEGDVLADPKRRSEPDQATDWKTITGNPTIWLLCGQQVCRAAGYMFFASWLPTFLQQTRGVSIAESGYLTGLVLAGKLAGCIVGGVIPDWIWQRTGNLRLSRCGVGAGALTACALLILAAWFIQDPVIAVALLTLGAFFAAVAGPSAFTTTIDIGGPYVPQVFGLMNMFGNFSAAACPVLVGKLFEWTTNWDIVLLWFVAIYLAGAVCWAFIDPAKHGSKQ